MENNGQEKQPSAFRQKLNAALVGLNGIKTNLAMGLSGAASVVGGAAMKYGDIIHHAMDNMYFGGGLAESFRWAVDSNVDYSIVAGSPQDLISTGLIVVGGALIGGSLAHMSKDGKFK